MKKIVIAVACIASLMIAKECKTMADLINGCVKTEYNYDKKPIKQSEWKNKKEVRVIYKKTYYDNGNLKSDDRGNVRKEYHKNGELRLEMRDGKPYNGFHTRWCKKPETNAIIDCVSEFADDEGKEPRYLALEEEYVNGVKNGRAKTKDFESLATVEEGQYLNGKRNGIWKRKPAYSNHHQFDAEFKDGKLIKIITEDNEEYEYLGDEEDIYLPSLEDDLRSYGQERLSSELPIKIKKIERTKQ